MNTPKYLEIAELIRIDIFVKYTKANQLIPSIRRYAQIYNVNPNTVSHAFRLLEADNIIYSYRTRGYYVSEDIQKKKEEYGRKYAKHLLNAGGMSLTEVRENIEVMIDEAMNSTDPEVRANFKKYFGNKRPTPEEYIYIITKKTRV